MQEVADVQELRLQHLEDISTSLFEAQYKLGRAVTDQRKQLIAIESRLGKIEHVWIHWKQGWIHWKHEWIRWKQGWTGLTFDWNVWRRRLRILPNW